MLGLGLEFGLVVRIRVRFIVRVIVMFYDYWFLVRITV